MSGSLQSGDKSDANDFGGDAVWQRAAGSRADGDIRGSAARQGDSTTWVGNAFGQAARRRPALALKILSTGLARLTGRAFFEAAARQLATLVGGDASLVATLDPATPGQLRTSMLIVDGREEPGFDWPLAGSVCEPVAQGLMCAYGGGARAAFPADPLLARLGLDSFVAAPLIDVRGEPIGLIGVGARGRLADIDDAESIVTLVALRAASELERQRGEERFGDVFEFAPDALVIVNSAGQIVLANQMAEVTLGYSRAELVQLSVEALLPQAQRAGHAELRRHFGVSLTPRQMGAQRSRLWAVRKDGTRVEVEVSLSPLRGDEPGLMIAAIRDVSERARAEEERARLEEHLQRSQKMESIGTLAGGIAHDFNNMLMIIRANTELAAAECDRPDAVNTYLSEIGCATSRAADLVRQILTFSRASASRREVTAIEAIVEEVTRLLRATLPAGIRLAFTRGRAMHIAAVDPTQLHQVVMNLATNAWHAMDPGDGEITFTVDSVMVGPAQRLALDIPTGRYVRLQVRDTGSGMDAATASRVFEPFFTTKGVGRGTGLGLAVVHGIVTGHGGGVTVESMPGCGTCFSVFVPEIVGVPAAPAAMSTQPHHGTGRVLLVEDELALLRVARIQLERLGYLVEGFSSPTDALRVFSADPTRFDVVLTDQNMPELSGLELARRVAAIRGDLPVVLMSGGPSLLDGRGPLHVAQFLGKPYTTSDLGRVLGVALGR